MSNTPPKLKTGCRRCKDLPKVVAARVAALEEARRDLGGACRMLDAQKRSQTLAHETLSRVGGVLHHLDQDADLLRQAASLLQKDGEPMAKLRGRIRVRASRLRAAADELRPYVKKAEALLGIQPRLAMEPGVLSRFGEG